MIEFESIKPWNGLFDSGKDVRLKLDRNFKKIAEGFEDKLDKGAGYIYLGPAMSNAQPPAVGVKDRVYLNMLVEKGTTALPNFGISQINLESDSIFQLFWDGEMWSCYVFIIPDASSFVNLQQLENYALKSDLEGELTKYSTIEGASGFKILTQAEYDALTAAGTIDNSIIYFVKQA